MAQTYRLGSIVTTSEAPGMQFPRYLVDAETGDAVGYIDEVAGTPSDLSAQEVTAYIDRGDAYFTDA